MSSYMAMAMLLSEGPEEEVTAAVRVAVYDALLYNLRHDSRLWSTGRQEDIVGFIVRGMRDEQREVRHNSG